MKPLFRQKFIIFFLALSLAGCAVQKQDAGTLTVWHWMSDRESAFQELARRYGEETGIRVKFELFAPSEAYAQRVKASAQTNTLPDIYGVLGEKRDFASFIRSGYVEDLTPALHEDNSAWRNSFYSQALAVNEFLPGNEYGVAPGVYGIPLDVATIQMVYNKKLYARAGLDPDAPPKNWEEFVRHCRVLNNRDIPCLVSGFGEIWMIDALAANYAMNWMGEEKVFKTYKGEVPYTDPDWVRVLSLFKQMTDEDLLVQGAVTMVNKTAEQTFANERAAYAFNGSWCVNVYKGMNPALEYRAMLPPPLTDRRPMKIWGGAGSSFVVNHRSPNREAAVKFLRWLTADAQEAYLANETQNLPSTRGSLDKVAPILAEFADDIENATHPNIYPVREKPVVSEAFNKGIQSILIGEKTPEEVAGQVQKLKEKEMRR
ncbi:MAG: extracellular solute-binding protein [Candidatus Omnitrophica bacterium]|nr:extracellular solute-binding protein [Candidatus Omnitrophota bacterium]